MQFSHLLFNSASVTINSFFVTFPVILLSVGLATAATSLALAIYLKTSGKEIIQKIKQQLQQLKLLEKEERVKKVKE